MIVRKPWFPLQGLKTNTNSTYLNASKHRTRETLTKVSHNANDDDDYLEDFVKCIIIPDDK